jgi:hypothetical protein
MAINHNVPYFSQVDNKIEPWCTCGPTSAAMCLKYFNVADLGAFPQYEDDVKARFDRLGIDLGTPGRNEPQQATHLFSQRIFFLS